MSPRIPVVSCQLQTVFNIPNIASVYICSVASVKHSPYKQVIARYKHTYFVYILNTYDTMVRHTSFVVHILKNLIFYKNRPGNKYNNAWLRYFPVKSSPRSTSHGPRFARAVLKLTSGCILRENIATRHYCINIARLDGRTCAI